MPPRNMKSEYSFVRQTITDDDGEPGHPGRVDQPPQRPGDRHPPGRPATPPRPPAAGWATPSPAPRRSAARTRWYRSPRTPAWGHIRAGRARPSVRPTPAASHSVTRARATAVAAAQEGGPPPRGPGLPGAPAAATRGPAACAPGLASHTSTQHHPRPHQVELLLDGQRPQVVERRRAARTARSTRSAGRCTTSCSRRTPTRSRSPRKPGTKVRAKRVHPDRDHRQHDEQGGQQPPGPPQPEARRARSAPAPPTARRGCR